MICDNHLCVYYLPTPRDMKDAQYIKVLVTGMLFATTQNQLARYDKADVVEVERTPFRDRIGARGYLCTCCMNAFKMAIR